MNEVLKCLQERRSCRSFQDRQLDEKVLREILTAGTYAASGRGKQSARIVVLQKPEEIAELERMNAAVLAVRILSLSDADLAARYKAWTEGLNQKILKANADLAQISDYKFKTN